MNAQRWVTLLGIWLALALGQAHAADIDCQKAHTTFEHFLCGHPYKTDRINLVEEHRPELVKLDSELNVVYQEALAKHFDPALLKREQRAWLKARERCVRDDGCGIFDLYRDRIGNLRYDLAHPPKTQGERDNARLLSMGSPAGSNYAFDRDATVKGYGLGICETLLRWVNHTTRHGGMSDPWRVLTRMPGLAEPHWQEIDIAAHEALLSSLIAAIWVNAPAEQIRREVAAGVDGKDQLWVTKEDVTGDGKPETLAMVTAAAGNMASKKYSLQLGSAQIVTDDLREVDAAANRLLLSLHGSLLKFKGRPIFIRIETDRVYAHGRYAMCQINNFRPEGRQK